MGKTEMYMLYLSTLSESPISYTIKDFYNTTIATGVVSFTSPTNESINTAYVTNDNTERNEGIHLSSTGPISVIVFNWRIFTMGEYSAYPKQDFPGHQYVYYTASPHTTLISHVQSEILLVGTEDDTTVAIKPAVTVSVPTDIQNPGSSQKPLYAGQIKIITLNRLQTFLFGSSGFADMTGTMIVSDKPLTVISGHECANVPPNKIYCEHVEEQIPPTLTWGKKHLVRSYEGRNDSTYFIIVSSESNTSIRHNCGGSLIMLSFLSAGDHETISLVYNSNCYIESNKPISITQMMTSGEGGYGDPAVSLIPSIDHYSNRAVIQSRIFYENDFIHKNYINILALSPDTMMINGLALNVTWESVKDFNDSTIGYSAALSISVGVHDIYSINGVPFHVLVYGYAHNVGYSFSAGVGVFKELEGDNFLVVLL